MRGIEKPVSQADRVAFQGNNVNNGRTRSFRNAVHHALSSKFENVRQLKPVQEEALLQFIQTIFLFLIETLIKLPPTWNKASSYLEYGGIYEESGSTGEEDSMAPDSSELSGVVELD